MEKSARNPLWDSSLSMEERIRFLLENMTLEEKIGMIHGAQLFQTKGVERLNIPPLVMSDGPMGVRQEFEPASWAARGLSDDYVTYLPCNSALASTWNRKLAHEIGSVLGEEARGRGKDVILAPGINIKRSPLCGRNFEYFSEDPYLTGKLAAAFIRGVQEWDVAACVKHFAANNQETKRLWVDVKVDEKALREIYLPAFRDCLTEGGALSLMGAYNLLEGEHCCQSKRLLNGILREEWGYEGVVISDWGAVHDTRLAAESGLDIEMSVTDNFDQYFMAEPLKEAVKKGEIPERVIDEKVIRILMLMMRLHMMDEGRKSGSYNTPEHRRTALEAARESVVLLKNEKNRLPLCEEKIKRLLVVGDNGERLHAVGGGSAEIKALYEISPLMGLKMLLGGNVKVDFVRGYCSNRQEQSGSWQETSLENGSETAQETGPENGGDMAQETGLKNGGDMAQEGAAETAESIALRREAVSRAAEHDYDAVIFVGGLNHDQDSEGNDRRDMKLPYGQDRLICELLDVRPDTVIVLVGGSPVEMGAWADRAQAIVWSYYAGMEGGRALAEVLLGRVNPSGRLPETFYKTHTDCSAHCLGEFPGKKTVAYREGIFVGYRYNETFGVKPRFCFGHGLSYTEFAYENGRLEEKDGSCCAVCEVSNRGSREGLEVVQVYRMPRQAGKERPAKELAGFEKVRLMPGETASVYVRIDREAGADRLGMGSSVEDIHLILNGDSSDLFERLQFRQV